MCTTDCLRFIQDQVGGLDLAGRRVLEVGAYDVNGSVRGLICSREPGEYTGVDIVDGPGVDVLCDVHQLAHTFGAGAFDLVVTTEMLEHVQNWRSAVLNLKTVLRTNGTLLVTTRSRGCRFHGYPADYWRFEDSDIRVIFGDMDIHALEPDLSGTPGIFLRATKTDRNSPAIDHLALYSVIRRHRVVSAGRIDTLVSKAIATYIRVGVKVKHAALRAYSFR